MARSSRERELARAREARAQQRAEQRRRARQRYGAAAGAAVVVIALIAGVAFAVNDDGDDAPASATSTTPSPASAPTETGKDEGKKAESTPTSTPDPDGQTYGALSRCEPVNKKKPAEPTVKDYDGARLVEGALYTERITTNCGSIKVELFSNEAPETTKAMIWLSDYHKWYDNTQCHRLTTKGIYVLQCGDPKGDGTGGPDFTVPDENLPKADAGGTAVYERGTVAMANKGPGTTGSQFFLVYEDSPLPPSYTVIGKVVQGLDVLDKIAAAGTADGSDDGAPKQPVQITEMIASYTASVEE